MSRFGSLRLLGAVWNTVTFRTDVIKVKYSSYGTGFGGKNDQIVCGAKSLVWHIVPFKNGNVLHIDLLCGRKQHGVAFTYIPLAEFRRSKSGTG